MRKKVIIIGDFVLSNINSRGLPKSKKVEVLSHPGATGRDMVDKIGGA